MVEQPVWTDEEKQATLHSQDFCRFFEKTTKFVERALHQEYDFLVDYDQEAKVETKQNGLTMMRSFSHEKWTKHRSVTDIDWSQKHAELVLSSYNRNTENINESDGLVLVWNTYLADRPEYVLYSQSDVMCASFSPFHSSIIVGGTYSGQVCIWDTRAKNVPVLKTSLSSPGHSHPIYALSVVGTQNAHHIVSSSTDGVVCSWQMDMLGQPVHMIELSSPIDQQKTDEVAVTCLSFSPNETTSFVVGTEQGHVFVANRVERAAHKPGIDPSFAFKGHHGMVTGVDFNHFTQFQDVFLTSSVDWTVKLWKLHVHSFHLDFSSPF